MLESIVAEIIVVGSVVSETIFSGIYFPGSIVWESNVAEPIVA